MVYNSRKLKLTALPNLLKPFWCPTRYYDMQEILIFGGIGVNVVGALVLLAYAMKYAYAFRKFRNDPIRTEAMKPKWAVRRAIGFGLMILGSLIAILGCTI